MKSPQHSNHRERSPLPMYRRRDRSNSPSFRYRSPSPGYRRRERSRSPSIRGQPKSPDKWTRGRSKSPNYTGRSRSPFGSKGSWQSNSRPSPPPRPKYPSNPIKRTYSAVPGAVGRFNSRMNRDQPSNLEPQISEWVCKPRGSQPGCTRIFYEQEEYIEHIRQRNMNKKCPEDPSMRSKWVCHSLGSLPGCRKVFLVQEEYNEHIRERNKTKECPLGTSYRNRASPRARSPSFEPKTVKKESVVSTPLYKGPTTEIILDDSPPYAAPFSPDPDISVSPPASPPRLAESSSMDISGAASPPPSNNDIVTIRDDGVLLIEPDNNSVTKVETTNLPKIKISNNLFNSPSEHTKAPLSAPVIDHTKRFPAVQRSPTSSPEISFSTPIITKSNIKSSQINCVPSNSLKMKSPSQIPPSKYPTVQRSPSYSSPGKSPMYQRSPSHLNLNISPIQDALTSPTDFGTSPRDPRLLRSPKTSGLSPLTSPNSSIPLPTLLTQKPVAALPKLDQELSGQEITSKNCQELYEKLLAEKKEITSKLKRSKQTSHYKKKMTH